MRGLLKRVGPRMLKVLICSLLLVFFMPVVICLAQAENDESDGNEEAGQVSQASRRPLDGAVVDGKTVDFSWKYYGVPLLNPRWEYVYQMEVRWADDGELFKEVEESDTYNPVIEVKMSITGFPQDGSLFKWRLKEDIWSDDGELVYPGQWSSYMTFTSRKPDVELYGDVNKDGLVNIQDALLVMRYVLVLEELDAAQRASADVNEDGVVDVRDVTLIMQKILGLIDSFPVEQ